MAMLGSGPFTNTSGSGYYTVDDYRQILRRAAAQHVEIIPEFDMPSHSHAAIKSMERRYQRLTDHPDGSLTSLQSVIHCCCCIFHFLVWYILAYNKKSKVKSFPSHMAHRAVLISISIALSQTPAYTARPRTRG